MSSVIFGSFLSVESHSERSIMHKLKLAFFYLVMMSNAYAVTSFGVCQYGKETVSAIHCYGPTILAETTVKGPTSVVGPLKADNTTMQSMKVVGVANLTHSKVKANVQVTGLLNARHGFFSGDVLIASDRAVLSASQVQGSITVQAKHAHPVIELYCGTRVTGGITFVGLAGVVKKSADSVIQGKVVNGTLETVTGKDHC